jgi:glutamyl-tRNA(Gln) amidotransferase subunit E
MRGLGTIRQDLNVSLPNGALVEIKGVQELELISRVVEYEVQRQLNLISISEELKGKKGVIDSLNQEFVDATDVFSKTKAKVIAKALEKNQVVMAVKLPGFKGLLKRELMPNFRLGTEMADRARFWGRVGGIFHTDEMPAYGVTIGEVEALRKAVDAREEDAVVFVADNVENATDALKAVLERVKEAVDGVPAETRAANPDGTTRYMRPRPGAARMYPETDIPPSLITQDLLDKVRSSLPEPAEKKRERLIKEYGLNEKLAKQVVDSDYSVLFEGVVKESGVSATVIAAFLTETMKALKRDGIAVEKVSDGQLRAIFQGVGAGMLTKEAVSDVFSWLSQHDDKTFRDALDNLGLKMLTQDEIKSLLDRIIAENKESIEKLRGNAFGLIMGLAMKEARGRADSAIVSRLLKERLR